MKVIKSSVLSIQTRRFTYLNRFVQSMAVYVPFQLGERSIPRLEQDLFDALEPTLEFGIDSCVKKQHPEFLVNGVFYSHHGQGVTGGEVGVTIGSVSKELYVFGDRYWQMNGLPSNPGEISEMPLLLANAFGGSQYTHNPLGKGIEKDGDGIQWLPNVEDPKSLLTSPGAISRPATLGPLRVLDSPRMEMLGPVGEDDDPFNLPTQIDWRYFNDAPSDQWFKKPLTGRERYRFSNLHPELSAIEGVIPQWRARAFIKRKLENTDDTVEEVPLVLDTLWFAPHKELGALVFHGSTEVCDRYGSDVTHLLAAFEDSDDTSRDLCWYQAAIENREDENQALKYMLYQRDIVPASIDLDDQDALNDVDDIQGFTGNNLDERFEQMDEEINGHVSEQLQKSIDQLSTQIKQLSENNAGSAVIKPLMEKKRELEDFRDRPEGSDRQDPELVALLALIDEALPKSKEDPEQIDLLAVDLNKLDVFGNKIDEYISGKIKEAVPELKDSVLGAKDNVNTNIDGKGNLLSQDAAPPHLEGMDVDAQLEELTARIELIGDDDKEIDPLVRPPDGHELDQTEKSIKDNFETAISELKSLLGSEHGNTVNNSELTELPSYHELQQQYAALIEDIQAEKKELAETGLEMKGLYLMGAHLMDEGLSPHNMPLDDLKRKFRKACQDNELHGQDWACLEFDNDRWDDIDLGDCYLEQTRFDHCLFNDVVFDKSIFARAAFTSCKFERCSFFDTNLGAVVSECNEFIDCDFPSAILSNSSFSKTRFSKCRIEDCQTMDLVLNSTVFHECTVSDLNFLESELTDCRFVLCHLADMNFLEVQAPRFVMADCDIEALSFIDCKMPASDFSESRVKGLNFSGDNTLDKSNFSDIKGSGFCVGNASLMDSNFNNVQLENAYFGGASLGNIQMKSSGLTRANFMDARMDGADFRGSNLFEANLGNTSLVSADFRNTNCFSVNFLDATLGDTRFAGADLSNTLIEDWRP